jgi:ABC-type amino acid transport substrate-binding protein
VTLGDGFSGRRFFAAGSLAAVAGAGILAQTERPAMAQQASASDFAWGDALKRIKTAGKIVFAQSGSPFPPLYSHDADTKKPVGYDVEIANLIARDLGVEPVFEEAALPARISGVQSGKYDVALGAIVNTPARALSVAFTRGYIPYHQVLLVSSTTSVHAAQELNDSKYSLTVAAGSSAESTARLLFPKADLKPMHVNEAWQQVVSGAANAILVELYFAAQVARSQPSVRILGGADKPTIIATEFGCIICRTSEMALRQWLDNWLYWYESHGVLGAMYNRIMAPVIPWNTVP